MRVLLEYYDCTMYYEATMRVLLWYNEYIMMVLLGTMWVL